MLIRPDRSDVIPDILPDKAGGVAGLQALGGPKPRLAPPPAGTPNPDLGSLSGKASQPPPVHQASILYDKRVICKLTLTTERPELPLDQSL